MGRRLATATRASFTQDCRPARDQHTASGGPQRRRRQQQSAAAAAVTAADVTERCAKGRRHIWQFFGKLTAKAAGTRAHIPDLDMRHAVDVEEASKDVHHSVQLPSLRPAGKRGRTDVDMQMSAAKRGVCFTLRGNLSCLSGRTAAPQRDKSSVPRLSGFHFDSSRLVPALLNPQSSRSCGQGDLQFSPAPWRGGPSRVRHLKVRNSTTAAQKTAAEPAKS